ncbi:MULTISPECIES: energy-coupling factor ABC transporter substrate-binding protein [unclassified Microcoleus]|uniref:energy-coupling factor ABC transporter substrate-binding protein n=1 Tax=unclassified Microcoleus TaxID=2642155 RepID=UPI002FD60201
MNQKPTKNQQASSLQNWMLGVSVVVLAVIPLVFVRGEYGGADDQAKKAITQIQPSYKPWFNHLFEPASSEISSLLFASQAAVGAGVVGYVIGLYKGRSQSRQQSDNKSSE